MSGMSSAIGLIILLIKCYLVPYIVGANPNSPQNPHSAMASGGFDVGEIDTVPAQEAYVLSGAVVGGPDRLGRFFDIRSDWPETEVCVNHKSHAVCIIAYVVRTIRLHSITTRPC